MEDCIFCKIINGIVPSNKIFEDDLVFAFRDIHPVAPAHILIIPKKHYPNLEAIDATDQPLLSHLLHAVNLIARQECLDKNGYRIAINCGPWGGQVVQHLHMHLLGGRKLADELG
ncbi:MAG: histidine triad nucleotide-binding protein [Dehalococcoidia bacterium]|nr:histidine triad nucleotide-binding protein [Dehalococcoidia bacterium]